jgi:hypothetical protein
MQGTVENESAQWRGYVGRMGAGVMGCGDGAWKRARNKLRKKVSPA